MLNYTHTAEEYNYIYSSTLYFYYISEANILLLTPFTS